MDFESIEKRMREESSVPMTTRVSIVDLAKLDIYWLRVEKAYMRSMSQIISWSIESLVDLLERNGLMPEIAKDMKVTEAHNYLKERGLYQQTTWKRGRQRIGAALEFESLREQGIDPKIADPDKFNTIHSKHAAEHLEPVVNKRTIEEIDMEKRMEEFRKKRALKDAPEQEPLVDEIGRHLEQARKEREDKELKKAKEEYRAQGRIAEEPVRVSMRPQDNIVSGIVLGKPMSEEQVAERMKEIEERDKKIREIENSEPDIEWMKSQGLIVKEKKDNSNIEGTQSALAHCSTSDENETIISENGDKDS